ncbi:DUF167 domain-containing protein [Nitrosomonas sp.]|uniref:DUF167 domain-containing protein n=1 Tax=Nitrosomonas sp. TaxID=42353 RepID=UPI0025F3F1B1|nr:DUF167 domain-containing protein [Nitrosomonas sp.]
MKLYIQPGARQTKVADIREGELKIKLAAPPVDGKANSALIVFLARRFNVPLKYVSLRHGTQSRHKVVEICQPSGGPEVLFSEKN